MSPDLQIAAAQLSSKPALPSLKNVADVDKAAKEFEAVFISQILGSMFEGIKTDGPFGGGPGEGIFRSLMLEEYAKTIANGGGLGLADAVKREILQMQEKGG